MHSFIRVNGRELCVENVVPAEASFSNMISEELKKIFGDSAQFVIDGECVFGNEENSENIFAGVVTGKLESEIPVRISIYYNLVDDINKLSPSEYPNPNVIVPGFIGFRK